MNPFTFMGQPYEYRVVALRECPTPEELTLADTPKRAVDYWHAHIASDPRFNADVENAAVLVLDCKCKIRGHQIVCTGTLDTALIHPREVFRLAVTANAATVILMHNHPSGDATPSEQDITATKQMIRAGLILKIELLDHIIIGHRRHYSLKDLGLFDS